MKRYNSFGISDDVLKVIESLGIKTIVFRYRGEKGKISFISSTKDFRFSEFEYDDNGDVQKHVPLEHMTSVKQDDLPEHKCYYNGCNSEATKFLRTMKFWYCDNHFRYVTEKLKQKFKTKIVFC